MSVPGNSAYPPWPGAAPATPLANARRSGLMSKADKTKLDGLPTSAATTWTALPFNGTWTNFGVGEAFGIYQKGLDGRVYVQGLVKKGAALTANDVIAVLPAGFRPQTKQRFGTGSFAGYTLIGVDTSGNIYVEAGGSATWTTISGIVFDPTQ